ncbi:MAG: S9 family peptidase, partial [Deltaproteobacteria bacterium]|nr:S9 family peptidase [Deltaproteobacteria bacterium]
MKTSATRSTSFDRSLHAAALFLVACGGREPPPPEYPEPPPLGDVPVTLDDPRERDLAEIRAWNEAVRGETVEAIHGVRIEDPYRALEEDTPATREWITKQSSRSARYLEAHARPGMEQRLDALLSIGVIGGTSTAGNRVFYTKREGQREQPVLLVTERNAPSRGRGDREAEPWATPRQVVDPTSFGERSALDWYYPSPSGRYVAFGISRNGDERSTLYVYDVTAQQRLPTEIRGAKWCQLSWMPDESGFYYTRYPKEGEQGYDADEPDTYWPRIYRHSLDRSPAATAGPQHTGSQDPLIFSGVDRTDFPEPSVSSDGRHVVVNLFRGWTKQEVFVIDARASVPEGQRPVAQPIVTGHDSLSTGHIHSGRLFVMTNRDAPRYRVLSLPIRQLASATADNVFRTTDSGGPWTLVLPESENPIEGLQIARNHIVVHYLANIQSDLRIFGLDGDAVTQVRLPEVGSIDSLDANPDSGFVTMVFSSFFYPPTLLAFPLSEARAGRTSPPPSRIDQVQSDFDTSAYVLSRESVPSRDGTPINVFFMHRRDMQRNGQNPVLLTGYGGFNVSLTPGFARSPLYWLERGGVYASANLRGGAEFGEAWHRAGSLANKERVFEDFEAVIRWFSSSGISSPERIGITGGSNGGLLMGAMLTRAPTTFRATATYVGLYDMVRYHRFPPAELWISEYGTAENAEQLRWLHAYSPYHRIREGVRYPAAWIETADHDTRVYWGHSTKFAARLQDAQAGPNPIYFFREENVGHGAGTQRTDLIRRYVRMYTFLEDQLGM